MNSGQMHRTNRRPRVGYLVSHPIQYQAPLFRRLARSDVFDFVALFGCDFGVRDTHDPLFGRRVDYGIDLLGGYEHVFLDQAVPTPSITTFRGLRTRRWDAAWSAADVDVLVLHGWAHAMMWQAATAAWQSKRPYLMRAESPAFAHRAEEPRSMRDRAHRAVVGGLLRRSAGALALGAANERFYRHYGVRDDRIHRMPYFVDDVAVARAADHGRADRVALRTSLGIPEHAFVATSVAKLMPRKRPLDLVRAIDGLPADVHVALVGSGELEGAVRDEARRLGVSERVHLLGFRPSTEVWAILGASDAFALPSEGEPWGLVINEAVHAGVPTLVTNECGAAEDLVAPGRTGEILRVGDVTAWRDAIAKWHGHARRGFRGDADERARRGATHSLETAAAALEHAVAAVTARPSRSALRTPVGV